MSEAASATFDRRHDLDALRATAMLLGIGLHAALSFMPAPWVVQDTRQDNWLSLFFAAIHGFRMPLFFVLSGFFTAMLWRKRGLRELLWHRFRRVFLPCMLGLVTIIPAVNVAGFVAYQFQNAAGAADSPGVTPDTSLWAAARLGDVAAIDRHLAQGAEINQLDPAFGQTPLSLAALFGKAESVERLIQKGADVNFRSRDQGTALHNAAVFGHAEVAELLLRAGADPLAKNGTRNTPAEVMATNWEVTQLVAGLMKLKLEKERVEEGRAKIAAMLKDAAKDAAASTEAPATEQSLAASLVALSLHPAFSIPIFAHLWFLWFLCWLVAGFALVAKAAELIGYQGPPRWLVISPLRYLWLIPLTMIPQALMGWTTPTFGPDTSAGLLPMPQVLLYYAIFFGLGALYYDCRDDQGRLGAGWPLTLAFALLVVFPLGLEFSMGVFGLRDRLAPASLHFPLAVALQVTFAWMMTFGLMGLFRRLLPHESAALRYLSDSSYWLYLAHVPLVILAQLLVRNWPLPATLKFLLICVAVTGFLLITYQTMVRYTWIGALLNGRKKRPTRPQPAPLAETVGS